MILTQNLARFLKENFSPEKQEAIIKILKGMVQVRLNLDKVSTGDLNLVLAKLDILLR